MSLRTLTLLALFACGGSEAPVPEAPAEEPAAEEPAAEEPAAEEKAELKVMFVSPKDGDTVSSPVKIQMGVEGMAVQAAGDVVEGTGGAEDDPGEHQTTDIDPLEDREQRALLARKPGDVCDPEHER